MKKHLLLFAMILLPLVASAHDIEVKNADGVTIYYCYINDGAELAVTFRGNDIDKFFDGYNDSYSGNVQIPDEVTYMNRTRKVTCIGPYAFYNCTGLTSVTIPNSIIRIWYFAFYGCKGITSITIPNSVTSIGEFAFQKCTGLISITIPNGVTSIEQGTFDSCTSLTSVTIPNSVTSIGSYSFYKCTSLTSITIPNSVTKIQYKAFQNCTRLASVIIPNSVTDVGDYAFDNCSGLSFVTIGNEVAHIGNYAFRNCSKLTSISIPNSVLDFGVNVFDGVYISTVISKIENPFNIYGSNSDKRVFSLNTFYNATLYVPTGTVEKYKITDGWKDFRFIEEGTGGGDTPTTQKCEKPTISYENGKLTFTSETEGAVCQYSITDTDIKAGSGNEVQLGVTYNISVYATKLGYENSETATATLCWIDQQPKTEGITNGIANIPAQAVLIQSEGGTITVQGCDEGEQVSIYGINGIQAGQSISQNGAAIVNTNLQPGSIAIVKIGQKSVKVVIK